jgi:hypothetical protein
MGALDRQPDEGSRHWARVPIMAPAMSLTLDRLEADRSHENGDLTQAAVKTV